MAIGALDIHRVYFPRPQRGGAEPISALMWSPRNHPARTMFYPNLSDGWATLIAGLSAGGMPDCISIRSTAVPEAWLMQEICFVSSGNRSKRLLQFMRTEDGLQFHEEGSPFDFEDLSVRPRQRIASRSDLFRFVKKLGIDLSDNDTWATDAEAIYLTEQRPRPEFCA
jgi:hypothetical protein